MKQISLFDAPSYRITKPIRLIELFAGIGSQAKALKNIGVEFEHYRICEFDKYAVASYNAVHGTDFRTSDITKISAEDLGITDTDKYEYIMTYSFPCTDLSNAGKMLGMAKGSGTRSGLLWEVERLLGEMQELPQVLFMENVPQVHGQKNIEDFNKWIKFLEDKGYSNYWQDLNAKNYGIPQNRNRCFMVSILGEWSYEFPKEFPLELKLKDMLEREVDEKFYIDTVLVEDKGKIISKPITIANTLMARDYKGFGNQAMNAVVYDEQNQYLRNDGCVGTLTTDGIAPTMHTCGGGNLEPKILEDFYANRETRLYDDCPTLRSERKGLKVMQSNYRIRKLTPKECWRLMGFDDTDFDKAKEVNSNSQLYKQAGNSIVVNVLEEIFKNLVKEK